VEEAFQAGKGLCGLDEHQVRRWRCCCRWVTLAMLAYAFLVVASVTDAGTRPELVPATTGGKPPSSREDYDLRRRIVDIG
jgi:hypothetical protein